MELSNGNNHKVKLELYSTIANIPKHSKTNGCTCHYQYSGPHNDNKRVEYNYLRIEALKLYIVDTEKKRTRHVIRYEHLKDIQTTLNIRKHFENTSKGEMT